MPSIFPEYEMHPYCMVADEFDPEEYGKLLESMRTQGFRNECPIVLYEGKILEGRHRYKAAKETGVEPKFVVFNGTKEQALDLAYFSLFARRHRDKGRAAALAVKFNAERVKLGQESATIEKMAKDAGVSAPYVAQASSVLKRSPEDFNRVVGGEANLAAVYKDLKTFKPEATQEMVADPLYDVWVTRDRWRVIISRLEEIANSMDQLYSRRGSEFITASFDQKRKDHQGNISLGKTILDSVIGRIKINIPNIPCECEGKGCDGCGGKGWLSGPEATARGKLKK